MRNAHKPREHGRTDFAPTRNARTAERQGREGIEARANVTFENAPLIAGCDSNQGLPGVPVPAKLINRYPTPPAKTRGGRRKLSAGEKARRRAMRACNGTRG